MTRAITPTSIRAPFAKYSHALVVPPGATMLYASGQLGVAPDDSVPSDVEAQCVLCFENIKAILADAGMTFADVVRFTGFVTGFTRPEFKVEVEITAAKVIQS
jgi:2-iminobutanoate/2-iminopropanoate deaminase